MKANLRTRN